MNKLSFLILISLFLAIPIKAEQVFNNLYLADSVYVRALDYYDESEDSSTVIEITYPKLFGLTDQTIENKINSFLEEEFLKPVEWFGEFVAMLDSFPTIEYEHGMYFSFETGFDIKLLSRSVISLVLNHYEFTGGAHGNFYSMGYTFDLTTGSLLSLDRVIKENSLDEITGICEKKIMEMFDAHSFSEAGLFEDYIELTFEQDFFLYNDALVLQFDPYEIAPYSMGNIEVMIPLNEIKQFIILDTLLNE